MTCFPLPPLATPPTGKVVNEVGLSPGENSWIRPRLGYAARDAASWDGFVAPVCGLDPWSVALELLYAAGAMAAAADRRMQTPACQSERPPNSPKTARATPEEARSYTLKQTCFYTTTGRVSPRLHSVTVGGSRTLDAATVSAMRAAAPGHVHGDRVLQNQSISAYRAQRSSLVRRRRRLGRSLRHASLKQYAGAGGDVGREILWSRQYLGERSSKKYQVALQRLAPAARRASPPRRCGGHAGVRPSHIRVVTARPRGGTRRRR